MHKLLTTTMILGAASLSACADHHPHKGDYSKSDHKGGKFFQEMDGDGDGVISKDEALSFHTERFEKMDADGDGYVTKDEMKQHYKMMWKKWKKKHHDYSAD